MFLKRLEIHGFKSFASKTALEFDKGIIAIVGPNGSGKSNVADSLRWVLGEQSPKLMRGKSSQDVIFAGSDKKTRLGFAEVIATFDNRDRRIPVDSAEVSIGRRIDRSGESEYLINGNKVRLLDIVDLVLKSNIGTSRYTVIGQGTIDQMILAGPTEVKNLVDEASGVKTYHLKRDKTLRRLEQTAQNLMRAEDLIAEIEPRLKSLRRQAKRMEARAELEQELKTHQREWYGRNYWHLRQQLDHVLEKLEKLAVGRKGMEESIAGHRRRVETAESGGRRENEEFRAIQEQMARLQNRKNKLLEDLSLVRGKMQSTKTASASDPQTLQVDLHSRERAIAEVKAGMQAAQQDRDRQQQQLSERRALLEQADGKLKALYAAAKAPASADWSLFDSELKSVERTFAEFFEHLERSEDIVSIKNMAEALRQSFQKFKIAARQTAQNPETSAHAAQQELDAVSRQKDELAGAIANLEVGVSKAKVSLEFLEKQLGGLEQERLHLELELKKAQSGSGDEFWKSLTQEEDRIKGEVAAASGDISRLEQAVREFMKAEDDKQKALRETESQLRRLQDELSRLKDEEAALSVEKARFDTQMDALKDEAVRALGEEGFKNIQAQRTESATGQLEEKIARLKNQLEMIGGMDELTLKEYQETEARHSTLSGQVEDLKRGMQDLRNIMDELDEHIKQKFNEAFHKINEKFENYFRVLFNGGRAYLSLVKSGDADLEEPLADDESPSGEASGGLRPEEKIVQKYEKGNSNVTGIEIKATPPGKKLANIQALSGGERSLTSIALLCSLLTCFPSPFVVLDEVDAALDDANTIRFGQILGTLAHQTQFLTITHNRETMSQSNILYGVTMGDDGISKLLSVKLEQAARFAK